MRRGGCERGRLEREHFKTHRREKQEEKKIRTNPAARTTDLLKTVFGK